MKYLLYCGPGIGDFILSLPMAKAIKIADRDAYIKAFCRSSKSRIVNNKKMMSLQNYIDELDYYASEEPLHSIKLVLANGFKKFDVGIGIQTSKNYNVSTIPSRIINLGSKLTYGFKTKNPKIKYDIYAEYQDGMRVTEIPFNILKVAKIDAPFDYKGLLDGSKLPRFVHLRENEINQPCISLCIGTAPVSQKLETGFKTNTPKRWPYKYWIELAQKLAILNWNVFLLGGNKEKEETCHLLSKHMPANIKNYVGKCSILESMSVLNDSKIVVGADTGLMHCAGALGVKTLTLFGCTDYKEYLPIGEESYYIASNEPCSPCFGSAQSVLCEHHNCMKNITVEQVFNKIIELQKKL